MENSLSFDEVMELGYALKIEQIEVVQAIKEHDVEVVEQVCGGNEVVPLMVEEGHQISAASSSSKWGFLYAFHFFDYSRKQRGFTKHHCTCFKMSGLGMHIV